MEKRRLSSTTHPHATDCRSASPSRPFPGTSGKTPQQHALILPCHTTADRDLPRQTGPFCCRNPPGRDPRRKDKKHARAVFIKVPEGLQPTPEVHHQPVKFFALIDDEHTRLFVGGGSGRQNAALPPRGRPKRDSAAKSSARSRVLPAPCRPVTASICDVARRAAGLKPPAQAQQLLFAPEKRHQVLPLMYFVFKKYDFLGTVILGC